MVGDPKGHHHGVSSGVYRIGSVSPKALVMIDRCRPSWRLGKNRDLVLLPAVSHFANLGGGRLQFPHGSPISIQRCGPSLRQPFGGSRVRDASLRIRLGR
jgi:hypothetical protein